MNDIRLKTKTFNFLGKDWTLCCNMNVLAEVQEAGGGRIDKILNTAKGIKSALIIGAAMLNDCADANGWPERFTPQELGRTLHPTRTGEFIGAVTELLYGALQSPDDEPEPESEPEAHTKAPAKGEKAGKK